MYSASIPEATPTPIDEQKDELIDERQSAVLPVSPVSDEKPEEQKPAEEQKLAIPIEEQKQPEAYRLKALMNVRKEPSLTAKILAHAEAGKVVNVHEIKDNWMKVNWYEGYAYILLRNEKEEFAEPAKG